MSNPIPLRFLGFNLPEKREGNPTEILFESAKKPHDMRSVMRLSFMHGLKVQAHAKPEQNFPKSFEYGGYAFTSYAYF